MKELYFKVYQDKDGLDGRYFLVSLQNIESVSMDSVLLAQEFGIDMILFEPIMINKNVVERFNRRFGKRGY